MAVKQLIERVELDSSAASITFSSIPQDGAHLVVKLSVRTDNGISRDVAFVSFNSNTSNFSSIYLEGTGSSVATASGVRFFAQTNGGVSTSDTFGNSEVLIANYSGNTAKSFSSDSVTENNATDSGQLLLAGLWDDTSAITSMTLTPGFGTNLLAGSSVSLYKITRGGDGTVTTA